eukprot:scaffold3_cov389-Prasinococcus_capsulatus_cf.AAC.25
MWTSGADATSLRARARRQPGQSDTCLWSLRAHEGDQRPLKVGSRHLLQDWWRAHIQVLPLVTDTRLHHPTLQSRVLHQCLYKGAERRRRWHPHWEASRADETLRIPLIGYGVGVDALAADIHHVIVQTLAAKRHCLQAA